MSGIERAILCGCTDNKWEKFTRQCQFVPQRQYFKFLVEP